MHAVCKYIFNEYQYTHDCLYLSAQSLCIQVYRVRGLVSRMLNRMWELEESYHQFEVLTKLA